MITLIFTNGQKIKTRCTTEAAAIRKAIEVSPVRGSIVGTKLEKDGVVYAMIVESNSWTEI